MPHRHYKVEVNGEFVNVQFVKGSVQVTEEVAAVLDALFEKRPRIAVGVRKADKAAAEKIALAHKQANAMKGGMTSTGSVGATTNAENAALQIQQLGGDEESSVEVAAAVETSQSAPAESAPTTPANPLAALVSNKAS